MGDVWVVRALCLATALVVGACKKPPAPRADPPPPPAAPPPAPPPKLEVEPITDELRTKGFGECNPHDPMGLGPYARYLPLVMGRIAIPQQGGHTDDMGYDVLIHFNGSEAVRKLLVQVARGIVLVSVEKGMPGEYGRSLRGPGFYQAFRASIESALRKHSKDERAHIRHLAVSSWSAGEVAIDELLTQHQPGIDAYAILDGMHAGWMPGKKHEPRIEALGAVFIEHEVELARRAIAGAPIFVVT